MTKKSFHLRWNNHLQNLQSLFENLYNEQTLVDVTISCSDGILYSHKLVLSACSPYFEEVFKDNPCKHPIIILKGIKRHDMRVLLQYMYTGSVDVAEEDLEMLLDTASDLQIKGLVQTQEDISQPVHQTSRKEKNHHFPSDPVNVNLASQSPHHSGDDLMWQAELVAKPSGTKPMENDSLQGKKEIEEAFTSNNSMSPQQEVEFEPIYPKQNMDKSVDVTEYQEVSEEETEEYSQTENVEEPSDNVQIAYNVNTPKPAGNEDAVFFCHLCSRGLQNKTSYHRHMLTHAGVKPHHCTFCSQSFLRLSHLQRHIRVHTGERPYQCSDCPKQFARSDKLRQHYFIQHNTLGDRIAKPRGRPRKNHDIYGPSTSASHTPINSPYPVSLTTSANHAPINSAYPVSINPVSLMAPTT